MINFRDKNQALPSGLLVAALAVLAATLVYIVAVPVPTTVGLSSAEAAKERPILTDIENAKKAKTDSDALVASLTMPGQSQDAETAALAEVTKLTAQHKLKLVGFRPQRGLDAGELTQLPFLITISGKFTDVVGFTHDIEAKGTNLSVNLLQVAASDTSTDDVTANINAVGYLNQPLSNGGQNG